MNPKKDIVQLPASMVPSFNVSAAEERGKLNNFLLRTWGGLGDQVCAEPVLRYAFKMFKNVQLSLATDHPELFDHLPFLKVYDLKKEKPNYEEYMLFDTIVDPSHLLWEFMSHCLVHAVDFASICAFRCQLPVADKEIILHGKDPKNFWSEAFLSVQNKAVIFHCGKHWQSKTFPAVWWNEVLGRTVKAGYLPVLIGADTDDNRSTVSVDASSCMDLRNRTNLKDLIWLLHKARVVITNDSSPLHIAASGDAHIGFIASCKHPDYITHWRRGKFGWRMKNLGQDGAWNHIDHSPAQMQEITVESLPEGLMEKILPLPIQVVNYIEDSMSAF